jgi:hypothetical protein
MKPLMGRDSKFVSKPNLSSITKRGCNRIS